MNHGDINLSSVDPNSHVNLLSSIQIELPDGYNHGQSHLYTAFCMIVNGLRTP